MMPLLGVLSGGGGPGNIAGLELWLDAADLAYLGNGATVTTWPDKSGNGRDFSCTNTVIYTTTNQTPRGGPVVSGTNWLAQRAPWMASAAGEIFLAWRPINTGDNRNLLRFTAQTGTNLNDHWRWNNDSNVYSHFGTTVRKNTGTTPMSEGYNAWYTTDIYSAASDWGIYVNSPTTPRYSTGSNTVGWGSTNHAFGNYSGTSSSHQIAEVCLYSRKLTAAERAELFDYLDKRHMPRLSTEQESISIFGTNNAANTILQNTSHTGATTTQVATGAGDTARGVWCNTKFSMTVTRRIQFTYTLSNGGADGFAVAFLSAASGAYTTIPAIGGTGGQMGIINGAGTYVEFITYDTDGLRITPFGQSAHYGSNYYTPGEWGGTHTVDITVTPAGLVTVLWDGVQRAQATVAIPTVAWIGIVEATGGSTETMTVTNGVVG